jgi:hypothetical protein
MKNDWTVEATVEVTAMEIDKGGWLYRRKVSSPKCTTKYCHTPADIRNVWSVSKTNTQATNDFSLMVSSVQLISVRTLERAYNSRLN